MSAVLKNRDPVVYKLKDLSDEPIAGVFYAEELIKIRVDIQKEYQIEKIVKKEGHRALVKWLGYPESFNSWVPLNTIRRLQ